MAPEYAYNSLPLEEQEEAPEDIEADGFLDAGLTKTTTRKDPFPIAAVKRHISLVAMLCVCFVITAGFFCVAMKPGRANQAAISAGPGSLAATATFGFTDKSNKPVVSSLPPQTYFDEWKARHSVEALQEEYFLNGQIDQERKFVLAKLNCPDRAGNILNFFLLHMLVAVLTNRTLVWEYASPQEVRGFIPSRNTEEYCMEVLQVASWIPKREDWARNVTVSVLNVQKTLRGYQKNNMMMQAVSSDMQMVEFFKCVQTTPQSGEIWFHDLVLLDPLTYAFWSDFLGHKDDKQFYNIVHKLYDQGHAYLRGMLFNDAFKLQPKVWDSVHPYIEEPKPDEISIGIHARHKNSSDDGSDISKFAWCLEEMVQYLGNDKPCSVYIASDRQAATLMLMEAAHNLGCSATTIDHENDFTSLEDMKKNVQEKDIVTVQEHGVNAGTPFFKDFALLSSQVRSGMIHSGGDSEGSSASALIWQQVVYNGIQDGSIRHPPVDCSPGLGKLRFHLPS